MFENVKSSMDLGYFNSLASILVAVSSPILGTIADYRDKKKRFFIFFTFLGVIMTAALAAVPPSSGLWQLLILFFVLSTIGFEGSNIFYDAFLVDVSADERMDRVSARGYAFGYISSCIPFGLSLALIFLLGMDKAIGYQIGFLITALWWGLLTIPMIKNVRQRHYIEPEPNPVINSFRRLNNTFRNIRRYKTVFIFLCAYFFYIDGVGTIIRMVVPYATSLLGNNSLGTFALLGILLIIQVIAFPFAFLYGNLAKRYSAGKLIIAGIITYIIACVAAFFISSVWHIFLVGAMIGSAQGGIQALSRSYYAKIVPKENSNEFFGFYNIFGKFSAIIGPTVMALITTITGNVRLSILGVIPLFIIGFLIFITLPKELERSSGS
jgi:UMF1 family MFS transporter